MTTMLVIISVPFGDSEAARKYKDFHSAANLEQLAKSAGVQKVNDYSWIIDISKALSSFVRVVQTSEQMKIELFVFPLQSLPLTLQPLGKVAEDVLKFCESRLK